MLRYTKLFLLCFSMLMFVSCKPNQTVETDNIVNQKDSIAEEWPGGRIFKGQIQSAGLSPEEMKTIGRGNIAFQLIGEQNYFLVGDSTLDKYWGSCVEISGIEQVDTLPLSTNLYGRGFLSVDAIRAVSGPCLYDEGKTKNLTEKIETLTGKVKRTKRPAPDIAYDYELVLDKPYVETNSQYEENMQVKSIALTGDKNAIAKLETAIDQNHSVQIEGAKTYGYAENIVFAIRSVYLSAL